MKCDLKNDAFGLHYRLRFELAVNITDLVKTILEISIQAV